MSDQLSVADRFCSVLAEVNKLKSGYDNNDPLRFAKNKAAMTCIKVLSDAIDSASEVVGTCKMFVDDAGTKDGAP